MEGEQLNRRGIPYATPMEMKDRYKRALVDKCHIPPSVAEVYATRYGDVITLQYDNMLQTYAMMRNITNRGN